MHRLLLIAALCAPAAALATPQISIRSISSCDTCHVAPTGWYDPEDIFQRKCTLNCNSCHVSPTGGGMRNESGQFYGRHTLPMFGARDASAEYRQIAIKTEVAATQPAGAPEGAQATSRPARKYVADLKVPAPGTAGRYAGIEPHPTIQVGTDLRMAMHSVLGDDGDTAIFPMQTDLYLAYRPYNPKAQNAGRVTILANAGFMGSRGEEFDSFADRAFVREWYAMYHDLPANMYVRAGRFLPAHGWRTDDHTLFTRQRQTFFGQGYDFERQVTGVEIGANPNYPYMHLSVFNPADDWDEPIDPDQGLGASLTGGWRDFTYQAGGSLTYANKDGNQVIASAELGSNLETWTGLPLMYLGQFLVNHQAPDGGDRAFTGLAAFHEVGWWIMQGLNARVRYDWGDPDVELQFDSGHQATFSIDWYPSQFVEVITQYRHAWRNDEDRFESDEDALLLMLHAYY